MKESALYEQVQAYINLRHPDLRPFCHWDLSGVNNPSVATRAMYSRLNGRAWPDFFLALPTFDPSGSYCAGLLLELKREGSHLTKKDGDWVSEHVAEQAEALERLQDVGFIAQFAVGFTEATELIESYLRPANGLKAGDGRAA